MSTTLTATERRPKESSKRSADCGGVGSTRTGNSHHWPQTSDSCVSSLRILRPEYIELVIVKVFMNLKSEASRTYLSFLWWILEPVMTMSVFYVVFGVLLNRRTDDFIAFLLVGLVTWQWFSNTISHGMSAIHHNSRVILSVDIPKEIFPLIEILMDVVKFSLVLVLLLGFLWIFGFPVNPQYFALPGLLVIQFM